MFNSFLGMGASTAVDESAVLDEMRHTPLVECVDDPLDACIRITYESTVNFNNITKALAMDELKYFQENGVEMVYEAGKVAEFFDKAKEWIVGVWAKVMGIFKSAIDKVGQLPVYAWYKANEKKIKALPNIIKIEDVKKGLPEGTKVKELPEMYVYSGVSKDKEGSYSLAFEKNIKVTFETMIKNTGLEISLDDYSKIDVISSKLKGADSAEAAKEAAKITSKEFKNELYNKLLDMGTNHNAGEAVDGFEQFSKKCINIFRMYGGKKVKVSNINVSQLAERIKDSSKAKGIIRDMYKDVETSYKGWITSIETARKNAEKANKDNKSDDFSACLGVMRYGVSAIKDASSVTNVIMRAHLSAIRSDAYRCQTLLNYALYLDGLSKKKDKKEEVQHNSAVTTESFLASLKMI